MCDVPARLRLGPYGVPHWSESAGTWVGRLTDAGRRYLDEQMARYDGWPIALLFARYRRLAIRAVQELGREQVNQHCRVGFVNAVARFQPERGTPFDAIAKFHLRQEVARNLWIVSAGLSYDVVRQRRRKGIPVPASLPVVFANREDRGAGRTEAAVRESEDEVRQALMAALTPYQREVVWRRVIDGQGFDEIGAGLMLDNRAARELFRESRERLALAMAGIDGMVGPLGN